MTSSPTASRLTFRDLFRLNPTPGAHHVALRAGISVAVPLLTVIAMDHVEWTLYAAFGAFAALYGRNRLHRPRALMQLAAGLALVVAVTLGAITAALDGSGWLLLVGGAVVAAAGSHVSNVLDWHPPGPLFVIFGYGAVATAPGRWEDVPVATGISLASALFAVLVGNLGAYLRRQTAEAQAPRSHFSRIDPLRFFLAVTASGSIALAAGIGHPYWAMVAAAAPLTVRGLSHQLLRGAHRMLGTIVGLATAAPLLLLEMSPVLIVLTVVVLQIVIELLVGRNYGLALLFITPMALLMGQLGSSRPATDLLLDRGVETAVGVAVAFAIVMAFRSSRWGGPDPEDPR